MKKGLFLLVAIAAIALRVQAAFVPEDERALADRLFMHWQTHATDVYVRGEAVVGVGSRTELVLRMGGLGHSDEARRVSGLCETAGLRRNEPLISPVFCRAAHECGIIYPDFERNSFMNNDFMVFSGTANLPLAEKVANYLGRPLDKIDIKHFPDGETFCQVIDSVRGRDVFVIQSGSPAPNEAYMELFIIMDALKRGSAARITAILPYYGYARQDRKDQPRVPITARLIANLLQKAGADRVIAMDLHANQIQGFFDIPLDHLKAEPVILKYIRDQHWASPIVVAPDTGGAKTAYGYSRKLKCGLAIVAKQRTGGDTVDAFSVVGDVKGHDVIMIDDMTATGGTLSAAAKMCRDNGAKSVHAFVSHFPLTEKGVERLMKEVQLDELVVTDSIPLRAGFDPAKLPFKLTQLSVAPLIGEAIRRTHLNESINDLFNHE